MPLPPNKDVEKLVKKALKALLRELEHRLEGVMPKTELAKRLAQRRPLDRLMDDEIPW